MFDFEIPLSSADLAALAAVFFCMITGRFLKDEMRLATYAIVVAVLTDNAAALYVVPLLMYTIKMMRLI